MRGHFLAFLLVVGDDNSLNVMLSIVEEYPDRVDYQLGREVSPIHQLLDLRSRDIWPA